MTSLQRFLARAFISAHRSVYLATAGRIGGRMGNLRVLLLTTRGRRSGEPRTAPLVYFEDGERTVVIASNGGQLRDPSWWSNLQTTPEANLQIGSARIRARARLASAEERARLWPRIKRENPAYSGYEKRTSRVIPVVILERC